MVNLLGPSGVPDDQAAAFFEAEVRAAIFDLQRRGIRGAALLFCQDEHVDLFLAAMRSALEKGVARPASA